ADKQSAATLPSSQFRGLGSPRVALTVSRTFGEAGLSLGHLGAAASGRRQARDDFRFPLNHLGICPSFPLGKLLFDVFDRALDLLVGHVLDRIAMLDLVFAGHQQDKQFQKYRRLVPHHLLYRLAAAATEGGVHFPDGVGVKRMTRAMDEVMPA